MFKIENSENDFTDETITLPEINNTETDILPAINDNNEFDNIFKNVMSNKNKNDLDFLPIKIEPKPIKKKFLEINASKIFYGIVILSLFQSFI